MVDHPDVSVVVIVFNDSGRLPNAVRSVTSQTLHNLEVIIVDDASTDETPDVARRLCEEDGRVRYVRLPHNSGGCSAPRNAGIEAARAPWVMFLDSDDTYERHACKNLLHAVETTGAELGSGLTVRVNADNGRQQKWFGDLYGERASYAGIHEAPDLLWDPLSVNKIYSRELLEREHLRFPVGVLYEDQPFVTRAYCMARGIAVVPNLIYRWMVHSDGPLSISNRRHELDNFRQRLESHRLIDEFLAEDHRDDDHVLRATKAVKFLRHDLRLYLNDLTTHDEQFQDAFIDLAAGYLETIPAAAYDRCSHSERIVYFMIRRRDRQGVLEAVDYLQNDGKLSTDLVEVDGRTYWTARHLDTPEGRELLDVTELGFARIPFSQRRIFHRVVRAELDGSRLRIEGETRNQLGTIRPDDALDVRLAVRRRGTKQPFSTKVSDLEVRPDWVTWSAEIDFSADVRLPRKRTQVWDVEVLVTWHDHVNASLVSVVEPPVGKLAVRPFPRWLVGDALTPYRTSKGNLALRLEQTDDRLRVPAEVIARGARLEPVRRGLRTVKKWRSGRALKDLAYRHVLTRLPVERGLVVFESQMGKQFSDSPRAIYEAMREQRLAFRAVWAHAGSTASFPRDATLVRRESWAYYVALARAEYWVDNQGFPRQFAKRPETTYLQTWHGTPLKKMGYDEPSIQRLDEQGKREFQAMVDRWNFLVVGNEYFEDVFVPAHRYTGPLLRTGLPRNDVLYRDNDPARIAEIKHRLDLPEDRTIVLYAPTFREQDRWRRGPIRMALELSELDAELSQDIYLLVRPHYLNRFSVAGRFAHFVRDVSDVDEVSDLYLVADVLVTDYSSVMFDYANLDRPMIFYTYDYDEYTRDRRGTYLELSEIAPGPLVTSTGEVIASLRDLDGLRSRHADDLARFRERFCSYETGAASSKVVEQVFTTLKRNEGQQ